jgi:HSP20 family protein
MTTEIQNVTPESDLWSNFDRAVGSLHQHFVDAFGVEPAYLRPARTDVTDTGKSYRIVAEVPGIPKDKLDIRVKGTSVEIRGENESAKEEKGKEYVHRERSYAGFYRALELPEPVLGAEAKAKVENGLLELELPKQTPTPSPDEVKVAVQ